MLTEHGHIALSVRAPVAGVCQPLPKEGACGRLVNAMSFPFT